MEGDVILLEVLKLESVQNFKRIWMNDILQNKKLMNNRPAELEKLFDDNFKQARVHLVNSHRNTETDMDLIEFIDTIYREMIIVIENGVLISSKEEDYSVAVDIEAGLKAERKIVKKQSNYNLTEGDKALGARQNIIQNMIKLVMNQLRRFRISERVCARFC